MDDLDLSDEFTETQKKEAIELSDLFEFYNVGENTEYNIFNIEIKTKEPWQEIKKDVDFNNKFFIETDSIVINLTIPEEEMFELPDEEYIVTKKDSKYLTTFYWIPLKLVSKIEKEQKIIK